MQQVDADEDGTPDTDETEAAIPYNAWTPRLLKAAYNYQVSLKDPGGYAHGGKYIIQLLYDSIEDLDASLVEGLRRIDHGHFAGSEEAFRHWDEDEPAMVSGSCSRCHSAAGLPLWATEGVEISQMPSNGFKCDTCHNSLTDLTIYEFASATFPSGATVDSGEPSTNLCMQCHQGRTSTKSVDDAIGAAGLADDDTVSEELGFVEVYTAPAAIQMGTWAMGGYQYEGK